MPRSSRDDAPGVAHHVMMRGIERRRIFRDDADRAELLRRLSCLVPELGFRCFAWALMPNHLHLVVRSSSVRISRLIARLATGYAGYFNRRHDRAGHLFQNRFRSRRVVDDADLMGLVLYVCRNPLEAKLARDATQLERFPWCGLGALLGVRAPQPFESVRETRALFDRDPVQACCRIRSWIAAPQPDRMAPPMEQNSTAETVSASESRAVELQLLLQETCTAFGVATPELRSRQRTQRLVAARAAFASRAITAGATAAAVARVLGVTRSGVSWMLMRERERRLGGDNSTT